MMKMAMIYQRDEHWYFQPSSKTTNGMWIAASPLCTLDRRESCRRKCEVALQVLNSSRDSVPIPTDPKTLIAPLLNVANVRSWAAFMRAAKCISIELDGEQLSIIPQKKLSRPKGALESRPDDTIVVRVDASPEEIGAALEQAMDRNS